MSQLQRHKHAYTVVITYIVYLWTVATETTKSVVRMTFWDFLKASLGKVVYILSWFYFNKIQPLKHKKLIIIRKCELSIN